MINPTPHVLLRKTYGVHSQERLRVLIESSYLARDFACVPRPITQSPLQHPTSELMRPLDQADMQSEREEHHHDGVGRNPLGDVSQRIVILLVTDHIPPFTIL